jgi:hypothetical protein
MNSKKKERVLKLINIFGGHILKDYPEFSDDDDVALAAVTNEMLAHGDELAFSFVSPRLQGEEWFVEKALKHAGLVLAIVDPKYQDMEKMVAYAVEDEPFAFSYASERLRDNEDFIIKMAKIAPKKKSYKIIKLASDRIKNDINSIRKIVKEVPEAAKYVENKNIRKSLEVKPKKI